MRDNFGRGDEDDFISHYLRYIGETEAPILYHRWCAIATLGTFLGRQFYLPFGHSNLHTNMYIMLIGVPAARKSTAIKIAKKVIRGAGYEHISADKTSKEKFLLDLAGEGSIEQLEDMLDTNLWGGSDESTQEAREMWIACDEFNDFIGTGNVDFISMLGNLWDFEGNYENRIKSGKSVKISNPTISILGGNTSVNFAHAFPPEILGQGFFSRLLLVQADPTGNRITFPLPPSTESTAAITEHLKRIKKDVHGKATMTLGATKLLDKIYKTYRGIDDSRFEHYTGRRFGHLLKLCLVLCASRCSREINEGDVVRANTLLTHTEYLMPKALGEFGKSRNSDVTHKIMQVLNNAEKALTVRELWTYVNTDMEKVQDLSNMLMSLHLADKIMQVNGAFLAKKKSIAQDDSDVLDYSYLSNEEKEMLK